MSDKARHVSSGSFRVDRARMLAKLREFQTPDPAHFILAWIRCAVASGAPNILVRESPDGAGLELRFEGLPFREAELEEPFGSLFQAETPGTRRNRYLALGILTALGLKPKALQVVTGRGTERFRLEVRDLERHAVSRLEEDDDETVLSISGTGRAAATRLLELVAASCDACPAPIDWQAGGESVLLPRRREDALAHQEGRARASVWRLGHGNVSELRLSVDGVSAGLERVPLPIVQVGAYWDDPELRLDASYARVVKNARYHRAREWLGAAAERLLKREARRHEEAAGWLAHRLAEPEPLKAWRAALDGPEIPFSEWRGRGTLSAASVFAGWLGKRGRRDDAAATLEAVWEAALRTRWLRRALAASIGKPFPAELWHTPLFFHASGEPLSAADIQHFLGRDLVAVFFEERRKASDWPLKKHGLWLSSVDDRTTLFGVWPRLKLLAGP